LPKRALRALDDDEEGRAFAARVLGKTPQPLPKRKAASS
jgi:hypothetical protein